MSYDYREIVDAVPISQVILKTVIKRIYTVIITPDDANELLENNNFGNRKPNINTVGSYALLMKNGQWDWCDGDEPLKFGIDGMLMNGQHRLMAMVASGVTGVFDIRTGVERSSYKVMDSGARRNISDYFAAKTQSANVSALAKKICQVANGFTFAQSANSVFSKGKSASNRVVLHGKALSAPTRVDIVDYAERNYDELIGFVNEGSRINKQNGRGGPTSYAFAVWLLEKSGCHDVRRFVNDYVEDNKECASSKQTILKKLMVKDFKPKSEWFVGVMLSAYDCWKKDTGLKRICNDKMIKRYRDQVAEYVNLLQLNTQGVQS